MDTEQALLEQYLIRAVQPLRHRNAIGSPKVLRCNACGDSRSQPGATSAAILFTGDRWVYKCQRIGCDYNSARLAERWLRQTDSLLYKSWLVERRRLGLGDERAAAAAEKTRLEAARLAELRARENELLDRREYAKFRPLEKTDREAVEYLERRMVSPKDYPFMVTDDESSRFHGCVIIPVVAGGEAVYWQARKLRDDGGPKYLNKRGGKAAFLMRTPRLDDSRPVPVCEGPFSALSMENSVCSFSANLTREQKEAAEAFARPVFCFDNDEAGLGKMNELLRSGRQVLIWRDFLKKMKLKPDLNDMNDVAVRLGRKVRLEDIEDCASQDWYDAQFSMW